MENNKSIFSFADKLGYESPLGDWPRDDFQSEDSNGAKIIYVEVTRDYERENGNALGPDPALIPPMFSSKNIRSADKTL